jgi:hypothetical protein
MARLGQRVTGGLTGQEEPTTDSRAPGDLARPEGRSVGASQRPLIERIGLGAIALVLVATFGAIALAAVTGGELFLGVMAGTGALMTLWAAAASLRRG